MNEELKKFLDKELNKPTANNTVAVFPLPCGTGKSEYIRYLISDALIKGYGLIVITDEIDRLNGYTKSTNKELQTYLEKNQDRIALLKSETISTEIKTVHKKPIILMSTQRYFSLDLPELKNFTNSRKKIVFDEKPYIFEIEKITINKLNTVDTVLKEVLNDTVNQSDKETLIECWSSISGKLQNELKTNEKLNDSYKRELFFKLDGNAYTNIFYKNINNYKSIIKKFNPDAIKTIEAVKKLLTEGIITSQKMKYKTSGNKYDNYFTVLKNNIDKLTAVNAKVYILDGTADISPEYKLKKINIVDCSEFKRDLSNLTINIVDVNTSKERLTKSGNKTENLIKTLVSYVHSLPLNIDTIFTYKAISSKFANEFKNIKWFGNIKGTNQYRNINHICQIGLNRYSDLTYVLYANAIGQFNDENKELINRIYDLETVNNIRCNLILADLEQNIYRSKIRNTDNKEKCVYTLICNFSEQNNLIEDYKPLIEIVKSRYEPLGATVNLIDTPTEFKILKIKERNTKNKSSVQKFIDWLNLQPKGKVFKRADLMTECKITKSQFKDIKDSGVLNALKTSKQGIYQVK